MSRQSGRLSVSLQTHNTLGSGNDNPHTYFTDEKAKARRGAGTLPKAMHLTKTGVIYVTWELLADCHAAKKREKILGASLVV